ncbi:SDR family oxidoreductase [Saprospiraceae bacterium]|nr:SDR family oxidoreductase [Saprospiraceae bacterium]
MTKIIIVTGGSTGIGAATVNAFTKKDAHVIIADITDIDKNNYDHPDKISFRHTDVSDREAVSGLIDKVFSDHGKIDVLVNNAGIGNKKFAKTADHTIEDWDKVIAVNQNGVFYGMKYALKYMLQQGYGNIVNVSSLAGLKASSNNIAYTASKFAVVGMTKSVALEYASKNIRINCVCPGYTESNLLDQILSVDPSMHDKLLKYIPMRRYGKTTEVAEAIIWLADEKTSFITGQAIVIDGGTSL